MATPILLPAPGITFEEDCPIAKGGFSGILPFFPKDNANWYLRGDGTWQPIEEPVVEHEELHTDNGDYDS